MYYFGLFTSDMTLDAIYKLNPMNSDQNMAESALYPSPLPRINTDLFGF